MDVAICCGNLHGSEICFRRAVACRLPDYPTVAWDNERMLSRKFQLMHSIPGWNASPWRWPEFLAKVRVLLAVHQVRQVLHG